MSLNIDSFIATNISALYIWTANQDSTTIGLLMNRKVVLLRNSDSIIRQIAWKIAAFLGIIQASGASIEAIKVLHLKNIKAETLSSLDKDIENRQTRINELQASIPRLNASRESAANQTREAERQLSIAQQNLQAVETQLNNARVIVQRGEELQSTINDLSNQITQKTSESNRLNESLNTLRTRHAELARSVQEMSVALNNTEKDKIKRKSNKINAASSSIRASLAQLQAIIHEMIQHPNSVSKERLEGCMGLIERVRNNVGNIESFAGIIRQIANPNRPAIVLQDGVPVLNDRR